MRTAESIWDEFVKTVFKGQTVSDAQYTETRRAFYGGMFACLRTVKNALTEDVSEEAGAAMLERFDDELAAFFRDVAAGRK